MLKKCIQKDIKQIKCFNIDKLVNCRNQSASLVVGNKPHTNFILCLYYTVSVTAATNNYFRY